MTFCLAIRVREGLVGIADTRVISGNENISARKVSVYRQGGSAMFVMTSGLRSVRDKTMTYFDEVCASSDPPDRLFKSVNNFSEQLRRVALEDKVALEASGLSFDIRALVGGQMPNDPEPKLYLVYPQGNWVEIGEGTPYQIIGAPGYGKPVLDRTLTYNDTIRFALKVGCLAFDSTRISSADVDFPIDVVLYSRATGEIFEQRFGKDDLAESSNWWQNRLRESVAGLPSHWMDDLLINSGLGDGLPAGITSALI